MTPTEKNKRAKKREEQAKARDRSLERYSMSYIYFMFAILLFGIIWLYRYSKHLDNIQ